MDANVLHEADESSQNTVFSCGTITRWTAATRATSDSVLRTLKSLHTLGAPTADLDLSVFAPNILECAMALVADKNARFYMRRAAPVGREKL
jgi:hypothetical protein